MTRLVAVLGYSDSTTAELHPVCAARLARAAGEVGPDDVVLFSGLARAGGLDARGRPHGSHVDDAGARTARRSSRARTTLGNAIGVARAARRLGADEVVS